MNMAMSKAGKGRAQNFIVPLFVTCATYNDIDIYKYTNTAISLYCPCCNHFAGRGDVMTPSHEHYYQNAGQIINKHILILA